MDVSNYSDFIKNSIKKWVDEDFELHYQQDLLKNDKLSLIILTSGHDASLIKSNLVRIINDIKNHEKLNSIEVKIQVSRPEEFQTDPIIQSIKSELVQL